MKLNSITYKKQLINKLSKKAMLLVVSGMLITATTFASKNELPKNTTITDVASKTIKEHVKFPNFNIYQEQQYKINVVFTVNETGKVNLAIANTTNADLKKSIEDQFLKLTLKQLKANNAYSIQFNFKIQ